MIYVTSPNVVIDKTTPSLLVLEKLGIQIFVQKPAVLTEVVVAFLRPGKHRRPP
jgi:hypothetical protein